MFFFSFFFFNDTATTEIYTLSLHDALPISRPPGRARPGASRAHQSAAHAGRPGRSEEHTSEPSHLVISYAVFCLKKKKHSRSCAYGNVPVRKVPRRPVRIARELWR